MNNYFNNCNTIEEIKATYHSLMKENHPDKGGKVEVAQAINVSYEKALAYIVSKAFNKYANDYKEQYGKDYNFNIDEYLFVDILKKVMVYNVTVEIIGYWIYVFDSYEVKDKLKEMGFWFSGKHKAWVYSGGQKKKYRSKMNLNDIRESYGSEAIKEHDSDQARVAV